MAVAPKSKADLDWGAWVFKCNPDVWDVIGALEDGKGIDSWRVRESYRLGLMEPGDPFYLWVTGKQSQRGIWLYGHITGTFSPGVTDPHYREGPPPSEPELFAEFRDESWLDPHIPAGWLLQDPRFRDPEVVRAPQIANPSYFTKAEVAAVEDIILRQHDPGREPDDRAPGPEQVAVEEQHTEAFIQKGRLTTAERREQRLVLDFKSWCEKHGDILTRHRYRPPGSTSPLYSDLFNITRDQLIEAKSDAGRPSVCTGLGQLLDYSRFEIDTVALGLLLPEEPDADLIDLLAGNGVAAIWRTPDGSFTDSTGGSFV